MGRIDHGVRWVEDLALVQRLARQGTALTVCPLSNIKLCVFKQMADHNLKTLLQHGLKATVNSDDPAYFGGYMNQNFLACLAGLDLDADDLYVLARNSFETSFVSEASKATWIKQLDTTFASFA